MFVSREGLVQEVSEAVVSVYLREGWELVDGEDKPRLKADYEAEAATLGIDVPKGATKPDLIALIEAHKAAAAAATPPTE